MIPNFKKVGNIVLGSSLSLPAHRRVEARATSCLAAHFALQNTHSNPAEKRAVESEGAAEGGWGGNFAAPERLSPAACSVRSRSQQKSFLFLLEEKIGRAQIKKCKENFFAGWRALASGGGASQLLFRSKKVRAKCKISPPIYEIQDDNNPNFNFGFYFNRFFKRWREAGKRY